MSSKKLPDKYGWEKGDIEIVKGGKEEKADISHLLTIGKALIERAGARHSSKDTDMVQRMHDLACELGAKCDVKKATNDYFSKPAMKADVLDALVLRHGTHNQKMHGNRHGVGGLREFASERGYKVREVKSKDGKSQFAITDSNDSRTKMRAGGLTEAKKLITSSNKFKKQADKETKQRKEEARDKTRPSKEEESEFNQAFERLTSAQKRYAWSKAASGNVSSEVDKEFQAAGKAHQDIVDKLKKKYYSK